MEVLFHFIFQLIKIAILGSAYAAITILLFEVIGHSRQNSWFNNISKKLSFWTLCGRISFGLFIFMFTYYGDHGLGDNAKIPLGHGIVMENTNWDNYGHIDGVKTIDKIDIETTKFNVTDNKLIGNLESDFYEFKNSYFIYDIESEEMKEFLTKAEFDIFAAENKLANSNKLLTFEENYSNHWRGWRFWLLP